MKSFALLAALTATVLAGCANNAAPVRVEPTYQEAAASPFLQSSREAIARLTDGFDMGAMALMPFVGKTDNERRVAINTIAPHWDGNQVWFITAGGAIFAAWPFVYATAVADAWFNLFGSA